MFISIGNGNVIREDDIIALIDYQLISSSQIMEEMISAAEKMNKILGPTEDVKSVMITDDKIYYSRLSVAAIKKRAGMQSVISKLDDFSDEIEF